MEMVLSHCRIGKKKSHELATMIVKLPADMENHAFFI